MLIRNVSRQCGTYIVFLPPTKFDVPQSLKLFSEDNTVNRTVKGGGQTIADHYWLLFWLALSKVTYASFLPWSDESILHPRGPLNLGGEKYY